MKIFNKRASFDFELTPERYEAGISLRGLEAKAFRENRVNLNQSYVKELSGEIFLVNANIPFENLKGYNPTRSRKLLLHKEEILSIITKMKQKKLQIVPVLMYNKGRRIKLELALGKPKKQFEKREYLKRKDIDRDLEREYKID